MSAALLGTGTHALELHNQVLARELPGREQPYEKSLRPMVRGVATAWGLYERPESIFLFLGDFLDIHLWNFVLRRPFESRHIVFVCISYLIRNLSA